MLYLLLNLAGSEPAEMFRALLPRLAGAWSCFDLVQVRAKAAPAGPVAAVVRTVREAVVSEAGLEPAMRRGRRGLERAGGRRPLIVANDRVDVALAAGADGVHMGAEDLPASDVRRLDLPASFVVGVTCHTYEELVRAPGSGADYAGVGAFYPSPTKPSIVSDPRPALGRLPEDYPLPLYAVGGLTLERLEEPLAFPQVRGVVVSSAIQASPDPAREARAWRARLGLTDPRMPPPRA